MFHYVIIDHFMFTNVDEGLDAEVKGRCVYTYHTRTCHDGMNLAYL